MNGYHLAYECRGSARGETSRKRVSPSLIHEIVVSYFGFSYSSILGCGEGCSPEARHIALYLARKYTDASLGEIGNWFDASRNTVARAVKGTEEKLAHDAAMRNTVAALERILLSEELGAIPKIEARISDLQDIRRAIINGLCEGNKARDGLNIKCKGVKR